jgi:hypothetical protein
VGSSQRQAVFIGTDGNVAEVAPATFFLPEASARITYNQNGEASGITARSSTYDRYSPSAEVTFTGTGEGGEITQPSDVQGDPNEGFYTARKEDGSAFGVAASAAAPVHDWNYQSFGTWVIPENNPHRPVQHVVVQTVGNVTTVVDMPHTGEATYLGKSAGVFHSETGQTFETRADVEMSIDFLAEEGFFATTRTRIREADTTGGFAARGGLDLQGTINSITSLDHQPALPGAAPLAAGFQFDGTVQAVTPVGSRAGVVSGQFYGPQAIEAGGTFTTQDTFSEETYIGAFGAKRGLIQR